MGKMMAVDTMRQLLNDETLQGRAEITWDVNNKREIADAEKKFQDYMADGWLAFSESPREGRVSIHKFDPKLEMIVLLPPLGGG